MEGFYLDMGNVAKEDNVDFKNGKKPQLQPSSSFCKYEHFITRTNFLLHFPSSIIVVCYMRHTDRKIMLEKLLSYTA